MEPRRRRVNWELLFTLVVYAGAVLATCKILGVF